MTLHAEPVTAAQLRVLCALVRVYERDGRATVRDVTEEAGLRSFSTTHNHLRALFAAGFVEWAEGTAGTLRPLLVYATRTVA